MAAGTLPAADSPAVGWQLEPYLWQIAQQSDGSWVYVAEVRKQALTSHKVAVLWQSSYVCKHDR